MGKGLGIGVKSEPNIKSVIFISIYQANITNRNTIHPYPNGRKLNQCPLYQQS